MKPGRCTSGSWPLLLFLPLMVVGCKQFGTHLAVPTPSPERYTSLRALALHAVSEQEVFVCGDLLLPDGAPEGLILRSEDGGRSWTRAGFEAHDLRNVTFHCVFFGDRLRGWLGGIRVTPEGRTEPFVFRTQDGGNHWRAHVLPIDAGELVTEVHSVNFTGDETGTVVVQSADPVNFKITETWFGSSDAGFTWEVLDDRFRSPPLPRLEAPNTIMVNKKQGFRLTPGNFPGSTFVEITASGGRDWLPVHELKLGNLPSYYAPKHPGRPAPHLKDLR